MVIRNGDFYDVIVKFECEFVIIEELFVLLVGDVGVGVYLWELLSYFVDVVIIFCEIFVVIFCLDYLCVVDLIFLVDMKVNCFVIGKWFV